MDKPSNPPPLKKSTSIVVEVRKPIEPNPIQSVRQQNFIELDRYLTGEERQLLTKQANSKALSKIRMKINFIGVAHCLYYFVTTADESTQSRKYMQKCLAAFMKNGEMAKSMPKQIVQIAGVANGNPAWRRAAKGKDKEVVIDSLVRRFISEFPTFEAARDHFKTGLGGGGRPLMSKELWLQKNFDLWKLRSTRELKDLRSHLMAEINRREQ